jgi:F-type H+-transporting ATPase subunit b
MNELITTFHLDWKLMLAQLVNFGLVFLALYFIAAKPLSKLVKDRTEEIETGLKNAQKAEMEIAEANIKKGEILKEAKENAKKILDVSHANSKEILKEVKDKAGLEKEEIMRQAKLDVEKEKKQMEEQVRRETAELIKEGIKKMVEEYTAKGKGENIIKAMINK